MMTRPISSVAMPGQGAPAAPAGPAGVGVNRPRVASDAVPVRC